MMSTILLVIAIGVIITMHLKHKSISCRYERDILNLMDTVNKCKDDIEMLTLKMNEHIDANKELLSINGDFIALTKQLYDFYHIYRESSFNKWHVRKIKEIMEEQTKDIKQRVQIDRMAEIVYPGFISTFSMKHPSLTDEDKTIIALMCCNFSSNSAAVMLNLDVKKLNEKKTRLARKLSLPTRISVYIKHELANYAASRGLNTLQQDSEIGISVF